MPITRYTQPVQSQYIPMDQRSYSALAQSTMRNNQNDINMYSMMKQRQEQDYNRAQAAQDQVDLGLAGIKAITPNDNILLNKKKQYYRKRIEQAIDRTGGKPSAMLPYLTNINREFRLDATGGDLAGVASRYKTGMEDLKQAKKDLSSGKLSSLGYNLQSRLLGTGMMVPRAGDIDKAAKDYLSKDFKNSNFTSKGQIAGAYINAMRGKYSTIYNNLDGNGRAQFDQMILAPFNMYYRNSDTSATRAPYTLLSNTGTTNENTFSKNTSNLNFDSNGNLMNNPKASEGQLIKNTGSTAIWGVLLHKFITGKNYDEEYHQLKDEAKKVLENGRKSFNIDPKVSDEAALKVIYNYYGGAYNNVMSGAQIPKDHSGKYDDLSLTDSKGKVRQFANQEVGIREVGDHGFKKYDPGDIYNELSSKLGYKDIKDFEAVLKTQDTRGILKPDGYIYYRIPNKSGDKVYEMRTTPESDKGKFILGLTSTVNDLMRNAVYNEKKELPFPVNINVDGKNTVSARFINLFIKNGEPAVNYFDKDGKIIESKKKDGSISPAITSPELIAKQAFTRYSNFKIHGK